MQQGRVVDGGEWCALAASGDVGAAEVVGGEDAGKPGHQRAVTELAGGAGLVGRGRAMQHGLAMQANRGHVLKTQRKGLTMKQSGGEIE